MYLRNLVVLAAAMLACQVDLMATAGEPIGDVGMGLGKKPNPGESIIMKQTDRNGRVQFIVDAAGTYELSIRKPGGIPSVPVGATVQLAGSARAVTQNGIKAIASGRTVLNPDPNQSQLLALGIQSAVSDTLIDEQITLSAPAILDLQLSHANNAVPTTGLTFVATEGTRQTLSQTIPINAPDVGSRDITVTSSGTAFGVTISSTVASVVAGGPQPNIRVTALPGNLKAGLYTVSLNVGIIEGSPAVVSNFVVPVNLLVVKNNTSLPPAVDKQSLVFTGPVGGTAAAQTIHLSNLEATAGVYTVDFVNPADTQYVSITPRSVTLSSGQSVDVSVQPLAAAFSAAGVKDVRIAINAGSKSISQIVDVKLLAVPPNCRASTLIPVLLETPNTLVEGLPSTMSVQVADNCGNPAYSSTVSGLADSGVTVCKSTFTGSRSNIKTNISCIPEPTKNTNPTLTLSVSGEDALGNQFTGSNVVALNLQSVSNLALIRDVGSLAQSGDDLSPDMLNTVKSTGFAGGQSITVTGDHLVDTAVSARPNAALPTRLGDAQLLLDGVAIPLIDVGRAQINAVLPFGLSLGNHQLVLADLKGDLLPVALPSISISTAAPEVVTTNNSAIGPASLFKFKTNGSLQKVTANNPAVGGDKIQFTGTGLGAVSPAVPAGSLIAQDVHVVSSPVTLKIGGVTAQVTSARLAPGNQAEYTVEATVPPGLGAVGGGVASLSMELSVGGATSGTGATASFQTQPITTVTMGFATSPYDGLTLSVNGTSYVTPPYPGLGLSFPLGAPVNVQIPNPQFLPGNTSTRYALAFSSDNPATAVFPAANVQLAFYFIPQHKLTLNAPAGGSLTANPPASGGFYTQSVSGAPSSVTLTGACGALQNFIAFNIQQPNVAAIQLTLNPATIAVNAPTTVSVACTPPPTTWTLTNPLITARYMAGATLLPSGKVIVAGGYGPSGTQPQGTVSAWGWNVSGQLGNGTQTNSNTPVGVSGLTGAVAVAGGQSHSLSLKSDGTVWAWGNNASGQLGTGNNTDSYTPVAVSGLTGVTAIAGGNSHSLALKSDGTVVAWGDNGSGQLGNGTNTRSNTAVLVSGLGLVVAIAAGFSHSLALDSNGTVWAWGYNGDGELGNGTITDSTIPVAVSSLTGVVAIGVGGGYHSLALKSNGTVWAWGYNGLGQLGNGTYTNSNTPALVSSLAGVMAIAAGSFHSLALKSGGTVWAWGDNYEGDLGNGTNTTSQTPVQVINATGMVAIAGGYNHSLALKSDGTVSAWGYNLYGDLGNGTNADSNTPVAVSSLTGVAAIASGYLHSLALVNSGRPLAVEIYDPATETWSTTTPLPAGHALNAIRLLTGEVLVVGDDANFSEPAHLFNETGATWTPTGVPNVRRFSPATALLASGDVLMAGGYIGGCCYGDPGNYETAEIYNRSSNTWTPTGSMATKRAGFTATVLPSGKVLAAGGSYRDTETMRNSAEIYDPAARTWSPAPSMFNARSGHTATVLASGQVLVVGGWHSSFSDFTPTAELYNPVTGTWSAAGSLASARATHTATLLPNGKVLVTGGYNSSGLLASSEVYDPATSQWTAGPNLNNGRARSTATLLPNGKVLTAGGFNPPTGAVLTSAELYH